MKNIFGKIPSESQQKAIKLSKFNKEKKVLKEILLWFRKSPYNPATYRKIWNLLKKLPYDDIPQHKDGFFYFDSQKNSQAIQYPDSSMRKDYKKFISMELLIPTEITKDCNIPYFQCLYWALTDMKKIYKFVLDKLSSIEKEISSLILNW